MEMTDAEIRTLYKRAEDKTKQIGILAELNACKKDEIRAILAKSGEKAQKETEKNRKSRKRGKITITEKRDKIPDMPLEIKVLVRRRMKELAIICNDEGEGWEAAWREYRAIAAWADAIGIWI